MMKKFEKWLETFLEEKGIDEEILEETFEVEGPQYGTNYFSYKIIIEHILITSPKEQEEIKKVIVLIDFKNGDVLAFFRHLGKALAK